VAETLPCLGRIRLAEMQPGIHEERVVQA
jgi:hypothetical protein